MRKTTKKIASLLLAGAMVVTSAPVTSEAATATVKLNKTSATVTVGKTVKLKVSKKNVSSKNKVTKITSKTWKSKKTSVATVSGGTVKGVKAGTATITCKVKYTIKKNKKTTSKTKTLSCKVTVNAKSVTPTTAPVSQAPATQAPASQAPASQAPASQAPASGAPASQAPASGTPASQTPASTAPTASASAAPTASASAEPTASASAEPTASASAAPSILPATAAPASATTTPTPTAIAVEYSGTQFTFNETSHVDTKGEETISFKDLFVYDTVDGVKTQNTKERVEIRISKVGDEAKSDEATGYEWTNVNDNGEARFDNLAAGTKYTFSARVKANTAPVHGAGEISTLEVSTTGTKVTVEGLKWSSESAKLADAGTRIEDGADVTNNIVESVTFKNASTGATITPKDEDGVACTLANALTPTKNTKAEVNIAITDANNKTYHAKAEVLVLVKAAAPGVALTATNDEEGTNVKDGYVKIATIGGKPVTAVPAGLKYAVGSDKPAATSSAWKAVPSLEFKNGTSSFKADDEKIYFMIGDSTSPAKTAEGGWYASAADEDGIDLGDCIGVYTDPLFSLSVPTQAEYAATGYVEAYSGTNVSNYVSDSFKIVKDGNATAKINDGSVEITQNYKATGMLKYMNNVNPKLWGAGNYVPFLVSADKTKVLKSDELSDTLFVLSSAEVGELSEGTFEVDGDKYMNFTTNMVDKIPGKTSEVLLIKFAGKNASDANKNKLTVKVAYAKGETRIVNILVLDLNDAVFEAAPTPAA